MELNKNIKVDEETFWELNSIRVEKRLKRMCDTIKELIKSYGGKKWSKEKL